VRYRWITLTKRRVGSRSATPGTEERHIESVEMPINKWKCSGCDGKDVDLDHFEKSECGLTVVHPDFANAVLQGERQHYARGLKQVEPSTVLGCPRSMAIQAAEDYPLDPLSNNAMLTGTAWHLHMEEMSVDPEQTEVVVRGMIAGVPMIGKVDRLDKARKAIFDWKHSSDWGKRKIENKGPKETHRAQLSIYAELTEQSAHWRPERGFLLYHYTSGGLLSYEVPLMSLDEVLEHKPHGGEVTVLDNLRHAHMFKSGAAKWQALPLSGEKMMFETKTMCDYCSVLPICKEQSTGGAW